MIKQIYDLKSIFALYSLRMRLKDVRVKLTEPVKKELLILSMKREI